MSAHSDGFTREAFVFHDRIDDTPDRRFKETGNNVTRENIITQ